MPAWPLLMILGVGLGVALRFDLQRRPIPMAVGALTCAVLLAVRAGDGGLGELGDPGALSGIAGGGLAGILFGGWGAMSKGLGRGESVLMTAVGAAFGFPEVAAAAVFVALSGAALALVALARNRDAPGGTRGRMEAGASRRQIPYAVAIVAGCVVTVVWEWSGQ